MGSEYGEIGLPCPPLDLNFSDDLNFSLSPDSFFREIDDDGNVRSDHHHHNHEETKRYGIGKEFRLLEKLYKPSPKPNEKVDDDDDEEKEAAATFGPKFECAKRKLLEDYEQVAREKKRRRVQLISLSDLPKCPPVKQCRVVKRARTRFAPALKQPKFAACY